MQWYASSKYGDEERADPAFKGMPFKRPQGGGIVHGLGRWQPVCNHESAANIISQDESSECAAMALCVWTQLSPLSIAASEPQHILCEVREEVGIISKLDHSNVIRYYTSWFEVGL